MILSPHMRAFNLDDEPEPLRDAYGRTPFGQGCLLARRLVQAGVTFVEVRSNGWDTHQQNHEKVGKLAKQVDPGFAALITDLKQRGMLEQTLVVWMGEFGRTPKINPNAGRDHFPKVFNVALAGGGVKGGQVIGASNSDGSDVKDHPVSVPDLLASLCHRLEGRPGQGDDVPDRPPDQDRRRRQDRQRPFLAENFRPQAVSDERPCEASAGGALRCNLRSLALVLLALWICRSAERLRVCRFEIAAGRAPRRRGERSRARFVAGNRRGLPPSRRARGL